MPRSFSSAAMARTLRNAVGPQVIHDALQVRRTSLSVGLHGSYRVHVAATVITMAFFRWLLLIACGIEIIQAIIAL
jgi:hypothetical protein